LVAKLRHLGVAGQALAWLRSYLSHRLQCVRFDGVSSDHLPVEAGVPQGSVLGPLLFIIYTHDLPSAVPSASTTCNQFADDTALTASAQDSSQVVADLQHAVVSTGSWLASWRLAVNMKKTFVVETTRRSTTLVARIMLSGTELNTAICQKHLGIMVSTDLRWTAQVSNVLAKAAPLLQLLRRLRSSLSNAALSVFYKMYIRPILEYASTAWSGVPSAQMDRLERFQRRAAKIILRRNLFVHSNHSELLNAVGWETLSSRRRYRQAVLGFRLARRTAPSHLLAATFPEKAPSRRLRRSDLYSLLARSLTISLQLSTHKQTALSSSRLPKFIC